MPATKTEPLLVQPKYDGISGVFRRRILATRGDGTYGEDITDKIPLIELESPATPVRLTARRAANL